ncbi:hypothetical protein M885DRAFT_574514 [Pelagophyceae sp. CCMP2097]|nr:hypothetical protein M885DRAFT_574514 [Pelagophyceae sp. CCMP2097]
MINFKSAARWYRRAADQGHPGAQSNLGLSFSLGEGVAQPHEEAVKWLRLAAAQGEADTLYCLGICYAGGVGVPQDDHEASLSKSISVWFEE